MYIFTFWDKNSNQKQQGLTTVSPKTEGYHSAGARTARTAYNQHSS
jgi:hypothetical protein